MLGYGVSLRKINPVEKEPAIVAKLLAVNLRNNLPNVESKNHALVFNRDNF